MTPFCRSTRESSCLTVVLNNLRVFLILEWLQLVQNFLRVPVAKTSSNYKPCHSNPSETNSDSATAALSSTETVMPKTVKSGVVTKRSTVAVTQDRCLDVKINVTGQVTVVIKPFFYICGLVAECPPWDWQVVAEIPGSVIPTPVKMFLFVCMNMCCNL